MGRPYSLIQKADELKAAKDNYDNWKKKTKAEKKVAYQDKIKETGNLRTARIGIKAYLIPFGIEQSKKIWIVGETVDSDTPGPGEESAATIVTKLKTVINPEGETGYVDLDAPTETGSIIIATIPLSRMAKITLTEVDNGSVSDAAQVSRITELPYSYRKRNSVSSRFGQKSGLAQQDYETARVDIKSSLALSADQKVYFVAQKTIELAMV